MYDQWNFGSTNEDITHVRSDTIAYAAWKTNFFMPRLINLHSECNWIFKVTEFFVFTLIIFIYFSNGINCNWSTSVFIVIRLLVYFPFSDETCQFRFSNAVSRIKEAQLITRILQLREMNGIIKSCFLSIKISYWCMKREIRVCGAFNWE